GGDPTEAAGGTYTITVTGEDDGGATGTQRKNTVVHAFLHVGDLEGTNTNKGATWTATATITVHDSNHNPVSNATVSGSWSNGGAGSSKAIGGGRRAVPNPIP